MRAIAPSAICSISAMSAIAIMAGDLQIRRPASASRAMSGAWPSAAWPSIRRYIVQRHWRPDSGYDLARRLMQLDKPPTAMFVSNYGMTIGVLSWMKDQRPSHSRRSLAGQLRRRRAFPPA